MNYEAFSNALELIYFLMKMHSVTLKVSWFVICTRPKPKWPTRLFSWIQIKIRDVRERNRNGIAFVSMHGAHGSDSRFLLVEMEYNAKHQISGTVNAGTGWTSQSGNIFQFNSNGNTYGHFKLCHFYQPNHSTLLATPLKTYLVDCTEVSPSFTSNPMADMNVSWIIREIWTTANPFIVAVLCRSLPFERTAFAATNESETGKDGINAARQHKQIITSSATIELLLAFDNFYLYLSHFTKN